MKWRIYYTQQYMKTKNKLENSKIEAFFTGFQAKYPTMQDLMMLDYQLGVDEAGRGPVMGPMVYSALWWPKLYRDKFIQLVFEDSKALTEKDRQMLFQVIKKYNGKMFFYEVEILSADTLSRKQQRYDAINLNTISHNAAVKLIRSALIQGFKVTDIFVDTVGDPNRYNLYIRERIPEFQHQVKNITVQPKADQDHKVVSASSICAKVTRDCIVGSWKFGENIEFEGELGSGYPGDPKTKQWLQRNKNKIFGFPNLIRFSWETCKNILRDYAILKIKQEAEEQRNIGINGLARQPVDLFDLVKQ